MATSKSRQLKVVITGDEAELRKAIRAANDELGGLGSKADKVAAGLDKWGKRALAASGVAAVGLFKAGQSASDLNESLSKSNTVFGENAKTIENWATGAADDFGQSKRAALDAAGSFGNLFVQLDVGTGQAADLSMQMTELASDFASFHNADITEVVQAQTAAFRGEYDALQRFVPTINAAAVEQAALAETGKKSAAALTAQEKALAVSKLMLEGAGDAMGDFDLTSKGAANQQRILKAELENMTASIGAGVLPIMQDLTGALSTAVGWFTSLPQPVQEGVGRFAAYATGALAVGGALSFVAGHVVENIDKMKKFATAVQNGGTAMKAFGTVAGVAGAAGAMFVLASALDPVLNKSKSLAEVMDDLSKTADSGLVDSFFSFELAAKGGIDELDRFRTVAENSLGNAERMIDAFEREGIATDDYRRILQEVTAEQRRANADQERGSAIVNEHQGALRRHIDTLYDAVTATSGQGKAADATAGSQRRLAEETYAAADAARDQAAAFGDWGAGMFAAEDRALSLDTAITDWTDSLNGGSSAAGSAGQAIDLVAEKQKALDDATKDAERSLDDWARSMEGIVEAEKDLVDAQRALEKALKGPSTEDNTEANLDLREAQRGVEDASDRVTEAQEKLTEAQKAGDPEQIRQAQRNYEAALDARQRAQLRLNREQEAYNQIANWTKENDPKVAAAQDGVTEAQKRLAEQTKAASDKWGEFNAAAREASEIADASVASFGASDASLYNNRRNVEDTRASYKALREEVLANIESILAYGISTASTVAELDELKARVDSLPGLTPEQRTALNIAITRGKQAATGTLFSPDFGGFQHSGGIFRAPTPGGQGLAMLRDGETVSTPGRGGGSTQPIIVELDGRVLVDALVSYDERNSGVPIRVKGVSR